jgi:hypothetical protein
MSRVDEAFRLFDTAQAHLEKASDLMVEAMGLIKRQTPIRRARPVRVEITSEMREQIERLSRDKRLTQADIARRVGLRNGGRVSEVLNGKR